MIASGKVSKCYMHELIAPGYGLIDNIDGSLRKRDAYFCFKFLIEILQDANTLNFSYKKNLYKLLLEKNNKFIEVVWVSEGNSIIDNISSKEIFDMKGNVILVEECLILTKDVGPVYVIYDKLNN